MKVKLNKSAIDRVAAPAKGRITIHDTATPGLCVRITHKNARTFYTCRWHDGRVLWVRLGDVGAMTIDEAQRLARKKNSDIAADVNPNAVKRQAREAAILADLWQSYLEHHAKPHKRPSSVAEDERMYHQHLEAWKIRRLADISPEAVDLLKTRVGKDSPATANRLMALMSCMFRKCGYRFGLARNWTPTAGLERYREHARDRVLSPEELSKLLAALKDWSNETYRDYFRTCLYTGARRSNVAGMRWEDVDLERRTWKIPGEVTKNGAPLTVALVDEAVALLKARPDHSPFVFPAKLVTVEQQEQARELRTKGQSTRDIAKAVGVSQSAVVRMLKPEFKAGEHAPLNGIGGAWGRIVKAAGIAERVTVHDLRRSFATAMIESGAALPHVAAALGHKSQATTAKHYAIAREGKTREAVVSGVGAMLAAAEKAGTKTAAAAKTEPAVAAAAG